MYKFLIGLVLGILATTMIIGGAMYKPILIDYCKDQIELIAQFDSQLTKGTLFLTCNGKLYEAPLQAVNKYSLLENKIVRIDNNTNTINFASSTNYKE